jgi:hypothetical protein
MAYSRTVVTRLQCYGTRVERALVPLEATLQQFRANGNPLFKYPLLVLRTGSEHKPDEKSHMIPKKLIRYFPNKGNLF